MDEVNHLCASALSPDCSEWGGDFPWCRYSDDVFHHMVRSIFSARNPPYDTETLLAYIFSHWIWCNDPNHQMQNNTTRDPWIILIEIGIKPCRFAKHPKSNPSHRAGATCRPVQYRSGFRHSSGPGKLTRRRVGGRVQFARR